MSCILRVAGKDLNLKDILKIDLIPDSTWEKGVPRFSRKPDGKKNTTSGARYVVSDADFDNFEEQKSDAISFLQDNENSIREIISISGIDNAELDFGIDRRDVFVQSDSFPAELAKLAGELGIGIMLSVYPESEEENQEGEHKDALNSDSAVAKPE